MYLVHPMLHSGADPELKKGGGGEAYIYSVDFCGARTMQLSVRASLVPRPLRIRRLQYVTQKPENEATYIDLVGEFGGMLPQTKV